VATVSQDIDIAPSPAVSGMAALKSSLRDQSEKFAVWLSSRRQSGGVEGAASPLCSGWSSASSIGALRECIDNQ
jgi:hypothetical protein